MINVTSILENANKTEKNYRSHVTIDGNTSEIACEIRVKDLKSELEDMIND